MKKEILLLAIVLASFTVQANHRCSTPISETLFKQQFNHILAMRTDQHRLQDAKALVDGNCLLSRQVKQIATLFHNDRDRLEFAKDAYLTTFDKQNFYDVYDAFAYFSMAFRLHDYVLEHREKVIAPINPPRPPITAHEFPSYDYPSILNYNEETHCVNPVNNRAFNGLIGHLMRQPNDIEKIKVATKYAQGNCLSVAQVMKIGSMIESERNRFIFLKTVSENVYDFMHFGYCDQLFTSQLYHDKFHAFLTGETYTTSTPPVVTEPPPPPPCGLNQAQFDEIKRHIESQTFNDTKLTVAKQIIRAKECFTSRQIAELLLVFAFEDGKLEIAKYAYDFCVDQNNYFLVNNSFTFDSSIEELNKYIAGRQ